MMYHKTLFIVLILCGVTLSSCRRDDDSNRRLWRIGQCGDFFDRGGYSSVCFIEGQHPTDTLISTTVNDQLKMCTYFLIDTRSTRQRGVSVKITENRFIDFAKFIIDKGIYHTSNERFQVVHGVGNEAYYTEDDRPSFIARKGNVLIEINGTYVGEPIDSSRSDALRLSTILASEIIRNLQ